MNHKKNSNQYDNDRRLLIERRKDHSLSTFPIRLECGAVITKDRRNIPERRLKKIVVSEQKINLDEFNELFKKFSPN